MEHERTGTRQSQWAPMRTMPFIRKARRPRRPVFRVPMDINTYTGTYEDEWTGYMDRLDYINEYSYDVSIDDILTEFRTGDDFSDMSNTKTDLFQAPENVPTPRPKFRDEFDSRFNLGGKPRWDDEEYSEAKYDLSADEDYVHNRQEGLRTSYTDLEDDFDYEYSFEEPADTKRKSLFSFKKNKGNKKKSFQPKYVVDKVDEESLYEDSFRDVTGDLSEYARAAEYHYDPELDLDEREDDPLDEGYAPPSFSEYLASLFASVFLRVRGTNRTNSAATMEDDDEDLGREVSCEQASKYYGSFVHSTRYRLHISTVLLALMCYISLGFPVPGMLGYLPVAAAMCMAMQFTIMLLGLDVVTNAILKGVRLNLGADGLAVISCIITSIDAAIVVATKSLDHMPLCALSSLSLIGVMYSSLFSVRGLRKALRVPAIAKRIYTITGENDVKGSDITLLKTSRSVSGFVRRAEEAAPDETLFAKLSPMFLLLAVILSTVIAAVTKNFHEFAFIFSSVLAPAVPFTALLCFAFPFFLGSNKIFSSGAAIAGWSGLCDVGQSNNMIVTDRDLFPAGTISIESIRIFADEDAQKVISYAGTMMIASGCGAAKCFADEMEQNNCTIRPMEGFEYLSGGGMKAIIDGHVVLCGSSELMRLMNVRFPFRLVEKTSVLLAIDGILYGIFGMNYQALPLVRKALVDLMRSNRHPIFALRDFNVTPEMLKDTFDIATDGYDFPPYVERFKITETQPSENSKIAAVVCREGLAPITAMADTGRSMYMATKLNILISALSAVLGMLVVFVKIMATGSIALSFILMFMLITALPVFLISVFMK